MTFADVHNGGAFGRSKRAGGNNTATAGGTGDAVEVDASWIDRKDNPRGMALSAKLVISFSAVLAQGATLTFAGNFQDATAIGGTGAADYGEAFGPTVAATGPTGGGTVADTFEIDIDLAGARDFVRAQITPNLSAANTDTLQWSAIYMLYGDQRGLATKSITNLASADTI